MYNVYVLKLENAPYDFFIYPRIYETNNWQITTECGCLYRTTIKTHQIKEIVRIHWSKMAEEIDGIVLTHMHEHGIEKVRGGSFSKAVLSAAEKEFISDRIKFMFYDLEENARKTTEICNFKMHYESFTIENLQQIKNQLEYENNTIKNTKINMLNYYPDASPEDLEYLRNLINTACNSDRDWKFFDILPKYSGILERLKTTYHKYLRYIENAEQELSKVSNGTNDIFYKVPQLYFDSRVIERERVNSNNYNNDNNIFKALELMIYTLLNRSEEFKFDLGDDNSEIIEIKMEIIEEMLKTRR
jgi:hypothetical protein